MKSKIFFTTLFLTFILNSCAPAVIETPPTETPVHTPTFTALPPTITSTNTFTPIPTFTPTNSSCQLPIRGTYNFSNSNIVFNLSPGRYLFYDKPGGGKFSNDQAGCELNYDCTQLRAINKDSAEPKPEGVIGAWVDIQTGKSVAQWHEYIVTCSLGK